MKRVYRPVAFVHSRAQIPMKLTADQVRGDFMDEHDADPNEDVKRIRRLLEKPSNAPKPSLLFLRISFFNTPSVVIVVYIVVVVLLLLDFRKHALMSHAVKTLLDVHGQKGQRDFNRNQIDRLNRVTFKRNDRLVPSFSHSKYVQVNRDDDDSRYLRKRGNDGVHR